MKMCERIECMFERHNEFCIACPHRRPSTDGKLYGGGYAGEGALGIDTPDNFTFNEIAYGWSEVTAGVLPGLWWDVPGGGKDYAPDKIQQENGVCNSCKSLLHS